MQYFTRQLFMPEPAGADDFPDEDNIPGGDSLQIASVTYLERREEIWDDLPKAVRNLIKDEDWHIDAPLRFVDDHFYITPSEELNFFLTSGEHMFILRYSVEQLPVIESPSDAEKVHFQTEELALLQEEWDIEDGNLTHRILLTNGFIVRFKPTKFRWWKVKVEAEA